jgi:YbbR domain-containing protein
MTRDNILTGLLSVALAILVWFVAVSGQNPFEQQTLPDPVPVSLTNLGPDLLASGPRPGVTNVTLRAPRSVWQTLSSDQVSVFADLSGLGPGQHEVALQVVTEGLQATSVLRLNPAVITVDLETSRTRTVAIQVERTGEPAQGFLAGPTVLSRDTATVSGAASLVDRVSYVAGTINLAGSRQSLNQSIDLIPVDVNGDRVIGVMLEPDQVRVRADIAQRAGYRDIAVSINYTGQAAPGYSVVSVNVSPAVITVASSDPELVDDLPGFVRTELINIEGATENIIQRIALDLPEGISVQGEPAVTVQFSITPLNSTVQLQVPIRDANLQAGFNARFQPETVTVFLAGPLPVLNALKADDIIVTADLQGLGLGTSRVPLTIALLPDGVTSTSDLPEVDVIIARGAPPTRTQTPTRAPTQTPTATTTLAPAFTPTPNEPTGTPTP